MWNALIHAADSEGGGSGAEAPQSRSDDRDCLSAPPAAESESRSLRLAPACAGPLVAGGIHVPAGPGRAASTPSQQDASQPEAAVAVASRACKPALDTAVGAWTTGRLGPVGPIVLVQ